MRRLRFVHSRHVRCRASRPLYATSYRAAKMSPIIFRHAGMFYRRLLCYRDGECPRSPREPRACKTGRDSSGTSFCIHGCPKISATVSIAAAGVSERTSLDLGVTTGACTHCPTHARARGPVGALSIDSNNCRSRSGRVFLEHVLVRPKSRLSQTGTLARPLFVPPALPPWHVDLFCVLSWCIRIRDTPLSAVVVALTRSERAPD